MRLRRNTH